MVRGGRAKTLGPRSDVSFRLDQKTAKFKAATAGRVMQWSVLKAVLRLYITVAQDQKTGNFKVASLSRKMQWSALTEGKQKNHFAA